ncbi:phospho-N-acetylmuramoyl-pentapeptide-transferase [Dolosigranulum savutiense]|uniref:Phospho-N-acetylmuramoyl-pentapeptide-transferase n=1 Tax=Dolosigranulum savutiense TaxID=3110288 RepID=A0AB74TKS6_9LACT
MKQIAYVWPLLFSLLSTILIMRPLIKYFRKKQLGQTTLDEGPSWHRQKSGTPTMGGVAIILAATLTIVLTAIIDGTFDQQLFILLFVLLLFGGIGFVDDYIKVIMKRNLGITSKQKFIAQMFGGIIFYIMLRQTTVISTLYVPFVGSVDIGLFYALFIVFWMTGFSNATNLTDGIDGLLSATSLIALGTYAYVAIIQDQIGVLYFILALMGAIFGFFLFNKKPAHIFMGDVGSLAIGASFAAIAILLNREWSLLFIGIIYVIETASVMIQVAYFKRTGKRIFKMTPIHHHFEMDGLSEWQIVGLFSLITLIVSIATVWLTVI